MTVIYPAIDLREGNVVRLKYGDPEQQTTYGSDPTEAARRWIDAGAEWLHVVNLDGAFDEKGAANWIALGNLAQLGVPVQFGGGVRISDDISRAIALGATRVILGTAAVENPALVGEAVAQWGGDKIVVGIDARDGIAKTRGWQQDGGVSAIELGCTMAKMGVQTVIHTDIGRDGVLTGVNWQASAELAAATSLNIIASGGVASLDDIRAVAAASGISGVITGRAIYDGRIDLKEAIELARPPRSLQRHE